MPISKRLAGSLVAMTLVAMLASASQAQAAEPTISYGGRIVTSSGMPLNGSHDVEVRFYGSDKNADQLGPSYPLSEVPFVDGMFQLPLVIAPLDQNAIFGDHSTAVYIEVSTGGKTYPRQRFLATPYALRVPYDAKTLRYDDDGKLAVGPVGAPGANQFLTKDGSGNFVWATPSGGSATSIISKPLGGTVPTLNQVLTYNGASWIAANPSIGVTDVTVTAPLGVVSGTTAPQLSIAQATGVSPGYITAADYLNFSGKLTKSGDTMTGALSMGANKITGVADPASAQDAATKNYVDTGLLTKQATLGYTPVNKAGDTFGGNMNAGGFDLTNAGNVAIGSNKTLAIGAYTADPAGLTAPDAGKVWFNGTTRQIKYYDGAAIKVVGSNTVTSAEIANGTIVDADVNDSAAIVTSKLSGAVTSITGHGLGTLATLSAVDSTQITDGSIVGADISASAAITDAMLATISTAGKVSGTAITSGTITTSGDFITTGGVGIGSATPSTKLDVVQTSTATGDTNGTYVSMAWNPSANVNVTPTYIVGDKSLLTVSSTNTKDLSQSILRASHSAVTHNGSGAVSQAIGNAGTVSVGGSGTINSGIGALGSASFASGSSGNMSFAIGVAGQVSLLNLNVGNTVNNVFGLRSGLVDQAAGTTLSNYTGLHISQPQSAGTITNSYGIYLTDQTSTGGGTQTNTPFGVYQLGSTNRNYFAGKVGIGSINPGYELDVTGTIRASAGYIGNSNFNNSSVNNVSTLGIGTTTPGADLSFGGTASHTIQNDRNTSAGVGGKDLTIGAGGTKALDTNGSGGDLVLSGGTATGSGTSAIQFKTAGGGSSGTADSTPTTKLTILGNGNIGIGTTAPSAKLTVSDSTAPKLNLDVSGNERAFLSYTEATSNLRLDSDSVLTLATNNSPAVTILSNGNVGIGTTAPASLLHTIDSGAKTATYTGVLHSVTDTSSTASINKVGMDIQSTGTWNGASSVNTGLVVNATGGTTNYAATFSGGNVGIGTTSPTSIVDVAQNIDGVARVRLTNPNSGTSASSQIDALNDLGSGLQVGSTSSTKTPSGAIQANEAFVQANGSDLRIATITAKPIRIAPNNVERMRIDATGKVGIGIKAPPNPLSVSPVQYSTGTASQSTTTVTGVGTIWTAGMVGAQLAFADGTSAGTITAFGSATSLTVSTSQTVSSQNYTVNYAGMNVTSVGNVGIGTTSPDKPLMISAPSAEITPLRLHRQTNVNSDRVAMIYSANDSANALNSYASTSMIVESNADGAESGGFQIFTQNAGSSTEKVRVTAAGNVGIGTTTPVATLDINGYMRLQSNTSQPTACSATYAGAVSMTSTFQLCACTGTSWVLASDGATACSWTVSGTQSYTTSGTFTWTVPTGVTSVSVLSAGGGGGGSNNGNGGGGGGGGRCYLNNIAVTPGATITVVVGSGGSANAGGGASSFNGSQITANGGAGGSGTFGGAGGSGSATGGTCYSGGAGGSFTGTGSPYGAGGGGAAGYAGNGGQGGNGSGSSLPSNQTAGAGGGGGGGGGAGDPANAGSGSGSGGGGVGITGQGANGSAGNSSTGSGLGQTPGGGGSGGSSGSGAAGGAYGGGGGGGSASGAGSSGAVRIIWGSGRSYPSNAN